MSNIIKQNLVLKKEIPSYIFKNNKQNKEGGGGEKDKDLIIEYLSGIKYIEPSYSSDITSWRNDSPYFYEVITNKSQVGDNPFIQINKYDKDNDSYYLANGYYSTAVLIKCVSGISQVNNILVIKYVLIKNNVNSIERWNSSEWTIYKKFKELFGNFLTNIYFYGEEIENTFIKSSIKKKILEYNEEKRKFDKRIAFMISEYCSQKFHIIEYDILMKMIIKLFAVMTYVEYKKFYISDFKMANIAFDNEFNWICIDYSSNLFAKNYNEDKKVYVYHYPINLTSDAPCYLMNYFNEIIKNDREYIKDGPNITKRLSDDEELNNIFNENIRFDKMIAKYLVEKGDGILFSDNGHKYYESNINLGFDKINSSSLGKIIIDMFFENIYYEKDGIKVKGDIRHFIRKNAIYRKINELEYEKLELNCHDEPYKNLSKIIKVVYRNNTCDKLLIKKFLYNFLQPLKEEYTSFCNFIKPLIFDEDSQTGLFAPEYENIPSFRMAFEYVYSFQNRNKNTDDMFFSFTDLIKENFKFDEINMENIFTNNSYYEWREKRKIVNNRLVIKVVYE